MGKWGSGEVEKWRSGEVEKWRSGEVEKWRIDLRWRLVTDKDTEGWQRKISVFTLCETCSMSWCPRTSRTPETIFTTNSPTLTRPPSPTPHNISSESQGPL